MPLKFQTRYKNLIQSINQEDLQVVYLQKAGFEFGFEIFGFEAKILLLY